MRRFVLGDLHGHYNALMDVFTQAKLDYENDEVIQIGDLVDRGPEPYLCMFELMKIKNCVLIQGNHDLWLLNWIKENYKNHLLANEDMFRPTFIKYQSLTVEEKKQVYTFLTSQKLYHVDHMNNLFVHAGFSNMERLEEHLMDDFLFDRFFFQKQLMSMQRSTLTKVPSLYDFNEIYLGHTATINYKQLPSGIYKEEKSWVGVVTTPINILNVWNVDTGAGHQIGKLTMMNIDTKEIFQSSTSKSSEPDELW